jgi:deoxyribonuclease-1
VIQKILIPIFYIFVLSNLSSVSGKEFQYFSSAKKHLISQVTDKTKTIYCDCSIKKEGKKLTPITNECGYKPRLELTRSGKVNTRAKRIEWEHIVPAWEFGHQLQCWQDGGRKNCRKNSEKFKKMEADINNLAPAIGEINGDRSNFRFGMLSDTQKKYGSCDVKIDFKQRVIEPPVKARKQVAEAYFYMQSTYDLKISKKQQQLFNAWLKQ